MSSLPKAPLPVARILHVSADYPDPLVPAKTPVIRDLIALAGDERFTHQLLSLNRVSPGIGELLKGIIKGFGKPAVEVSTAAFADGLTCAYRAPSRGIFHATMLWQMGEAIARSYASGTGDYCLPDLIMGHKLTVEGLVAHRAAELLGCPFGITIQGNTDCKILAARPDLARLFGRIFHEAATLVAFAPWALHRFEKRFGKRQGPTYLVPCPTDLDTMMQPRMGDGRLVSVFHLRNWHTKNLDGMARALNLLEKGRHALALTIVGGGEAGEEAEARKAAARCRSVEFVGAPSRDDLPGLINAASGFVMPSRRETYGLVFLEALFAGLPVIYPKGRAIDGYFDGLPFAIGVDPHDHGAIAAAMRQVVKEEEALKRSLAVWQGSNEAKAFTRSAIGHSFAKALDAGVARSQKQALFTEHD